MPTQLEGEQGWLLTSFDTKPCEAGKALALINRFVRGHLHAAWVG